MNKNRAVFFGTGAFAVPILERLCSSDLDIQAVVTQEPKPAGRGNAKRASPILLYAKSRDALVLTPETLSEQSFAAKLKDLSPDICILAAYGRIVPQNILHIPRLGFVNVHPSLLPAYRGPTPVQTALLNGDMHTGVSIIQMDAQVDHGPVIARKEVLIPNDATGKSLEGLLSRAGAELLSNTLPLFIHGILKSQPQDDSVATFTKKLSREDGHIDWTKSALFIERMIRAYDEWPSAFGLVEAQGLRHNLKVLRAEVLESNDGVMPAGTILRGTDSKFRVQCGEGVLILNEVQPEGKKPMSGANFLRGHPQWIGAKFK